MEDVIVLAARAAVQPSKPEHLRVLLMLGFPEEAGQAQPARHATTGAKLNESVAKEFGIEVPPDTKWAVCYVVMVQEEDEERFEFPITWNEAQDLIADLRGGAATVEALGGTRCVRITRNDFREQVADPMHTFFGMAEGLGRTTHFVLGRDGLRLRGVDSPQPESCQTHERAEALLMNYLQYDPMYH